MKTEIYILTHLAYMIIPPLCLPLLYSFYSVPSRNRRPFRRSPPAVAAVVLPMKGPR